MDLHFSTSLQSSLGTGYTLLGELGGGSMSRVFVAEEHALGRRVVVKVLPHYLVTEVSLERFRREIQLAAALQHPLIVPVLSAGESDGMRYYTMPFIAGESLRAVLARREWLELPEVLVVLRDVAGALAYAHRRGVVHRDIKPDNVLLCEDHALVTDFGVARALEGASVRHLQVTSDGEAVGTAAYMAPEQVTGDPGADHRVDIYALGILAYELLTGKPPFTGMSLHGILTAHLADDPVPPVEVRPEIGRPLSDLVLRCLAKRPEDRPASADLLLEELEAVGGGSRRSLARVTGAAPTIGATPAYRSHAGPISDGALRTTSPGSAARRRRRRLVVATAVTVAVAAGALVGLDAWRERGDRAAAAAELNAGGAVAVLPFRVAASDSSLAYLREGMIDLLAAKLTGTTGPRALDPRSVTNAIRDVAGVQGGDVGEAQALELARRLGASQLVLGGIVGSPQRLVFTATLRDVPAGTVRAEASVAGSADSLLTLVDRLAAQLLAAQARVDRARLGDLTSRSLPALKEYLAGNAEFRRGSFVNARAHYDRALSLDSNFALAVLGNAAAGAYGQPHEAARVAAGVRTAYRLRERLSARDRALFDAYVPARHGAIRNAADDLAAWQRATELAPELPDTWYGYADRLFHTGAWLGIPDPWQRAAPAFSRALELDSTFVPPMSHLVEIAAEVGDLRQLYQTSALYFARDSAADEADGIRWRVAVAQGDRRTRERIRDEMPGYAVATLARIMALGQIEGVAFDDVDRAAATLRTMAVPQNLRITAALALHNFELNRGHPRHAVEALAAVRRAGFPARAIGSFYNLSELVVLDAMFGGGDTTAALPDVRALAARIEEPDLPAHEARGEQYADVCTAELWRVRRGDLSTVDRSLARLRAGASPRDSVGFFGGSPLVCLTILEAELAATRRSPGLRARVARLDSVMRTGPTLFGADFGNLVLARLHESLGDDASALAALRRRPYYALTGTLFLAPVLREQARLLAQLGERESAIATYRHYMTLRSTTPDPVVRPELEQVKAALRALGG